MMSQDVFKAPKAKKRQGSGGKGNPEMWSPKKKRRTQDDFFTFCNIVLEYTQYESMKQEELRLRNNTSPLDSSGSTADSFTSESPSSSMSEVEMEEKLMLERISTMSNLRSGVDRRDGDVDTDEDSWDLVTCYCMKPFAGRPMIECSECYTWIHLSCAKIRKSNIPEEYVCQRCRESKFTTRKSNRIRSEKRPLNA